MTDLNLPLQFFVSASDETLDSIALKRLNHAANLEKEAIELEKEAATIRNEAHRARESAEVVEWLRKNRRKLLEAAHLEKVEADAGEKVA